MAGVLAIDNDHDILTQYCRAFRRCLVFDVFVGTHFNHTLFCEHTRTAAHQRLSSEAIDLVTGTGHGNSATFFGANGEQIFSASDDLSLLRDKVVHLLSCETALVLGKEIMKSGAKAFWGYLDKFKFYYHDPSPLSLQDDEVAEAFIAMDIVILSGLLSGATATQILSNVEDYVWVTYAQIPLLCPSDPISAQAAFASNFTRLVGPHINWGDPLHQVPQ